MRGKRLWGFDVAQQRLLFDATTNLPRLRTVIERATPDVDGFLVLKATLNELDEMYDLVSALMDATHDKARLQQLDGLLASLCTSIDGF